MSENELPKSGTRPKVSRGFLITLGILAILAVVGKPVQRPNSGYNSGNTNTKNDFSIKYKT